MPFQRPLVKTSVEIADSAHAEYSASAVASHWRASVQTCANAGADKNVANATAGSRHTPPTRADSKSSSARRLAHAAPVERMHARAASPSRSRHDVMVAAQVASVLLRDSKKRAATDDRVKEHYSLTRWGPTLAARLHHLAGDA